MENDLLLVAIVSIIILIVILFFFISAGCIENKKAPYGEEKKQLRKLQPTISITTMKKPIITETIYL